MQKRLDGSALLFIKNTVGGIMTAEKRRHGRPWKAPTTERVQLISIVAAETKLAVMASAQRSGRTQSDEIERLLRRALRLAPHPERVEP
jgi:hypothetical protein